MNSRERFKAAFEGKLTRPPMWIMRQAGRYLPEYRALKEKYGFLGIVHTPELAAEATLQPIRRFGFDCAILFCDILALSEALGFPYAFRDKGGIELKRTVRSMSDVSKISPMLVSEKLEYVSEALKILRAQLNDTALIGFCASPFTLAAYMIEGGSSNGEFPIFKEFASAEPDVLDKLLCALSDASAEYLKMQVECGIDAFQIFDSHASLAPSGRYGQISGKWISRTLKKVGKTNAKSIVFTPSMSERFGEVLSSVSADAYSVDSSIPLSELAKKWNAKDAVLQGNLDPMSLSNDIPEIVSKKTLSILKDSLAIGGHIFNLGHGIKPDAKISNVEAMCETVKNFNSEQI